MLAMFARPDKYVMVGHEISQKRTAPSRAIRMRLEVFLVAGMLFLLIAVPAFGMVKKATASMNCVRGAFQTTQTTCSNP
jgi:hypothetical protein